jgi:2-hydroxychromene-2-carboxylate isomerase
MTPQKAEYAQGTTPATLGDVIEGADLFLGLSGPGVLTRTWSRAWPRNPIVFALANPTPEILPDEVREVAPDAIIATGRSDFPNQVNNVLCFPFIFRGALDVGATEINDAMQIACIEGIAALARATTSAEAAAAYQGEQLTFGRDYLIPKPFDPRLMAVVASAVAKAAIASRASRRGPRRHRGLQGEAEPVGLPLRADHAPCLRRRRHHLARRIVFAEGEDERVLRAAQAMLEETTDTPILIGRPEVIERRAERAGLTIRPSVDFELVNPESDPRYRDYWEHLSFGDGAPRRHPRPRARHHAHQHDRDRRRHGLSGRGGFDDLRHLRPIPLAPELRPATPWNAEASSNRRTEPDDPGGRSALHRRYPCPRPAEPRADRRDRHRHRASREAVRGGAQHRSLFRQPVRQSRQRQRAAHARGA